MPSVRSDQHLPGVAVDAQSGMPMRAVARMIPSTRRCSRDCTATRSASGRSSVVATTANRPRAAAAAAISS